VLAVVSGLDKPVAIHGGPAVPGAQVVSIDNRASARELAARTFPGARRPTVLSFPFDRDRRPRLETGPNPERVEFPVTRERLLGIYDHCLEAGLDPLRLPVAVVARNDRNDAADMADALLGSCDTDAVIAMSDQLAFAVLDNARRRGLHVPDDVAVAGWDDDPVARQEGLTTIVQSLFDQGRTCALIALSDPAPSRNAAWTAMVRTSTR
jgi:DNA-binding LacI/PurR family transcriptional regulator